MKYSKTNKYHNKKVIIDGIEFDSQKEGNYYLKLKMLQKAGKIKNLKLQVEFVLLETIRVGESTYRKTKYIADFTYLDEENKLHVVDVKGFKTKDYILKKKLMAWKYGINVEEV